MYEITEVHQPRQREQKELKIANASQFIPGTSRRFRGQRYINKKYITLEIFRVAECTGGLLYHQTLSTDLLKMETGSK